MGHPEHGRRPHFDCITASPPCTEFSVAKTTAVRDLETADFLVMRTLRCILELNPKVWFIENPQTGLLKTRPYMGMLDYWDTSYCQYGTEYKKATRFWNNAEWADWPACSKACPCRNFQETGRHPMSAQRGPSRVMGVVREGDTCSLNQLYSIPHSLCLSIAQHCTDRIIDLGL